MSDDRLIPRHGDIDDLINHLIEECGEAIAAAGKTKRFGLGSYNPFVPKDERETNEEWLRRELCDLLKAGNRLRDALEAKGRKP